MIQVPRSQSLATTQGPVSVTTATGGFQAAAPHPPPAPPAPPSTLREAAHSKQIIQCSPSNCIQIVNSQQIVTNQTINQVFTISLVIYSYYLFVLAVFVSLIILITIIIDKY